MIKREELRVRDPFILVHDGRYYLYANHFDDRKRGSIVAYISDDLDSWDDPVTVFAPPEGYWADRDFFAPEVHAYRGGYVLLVTLRAEGRHRATSALRALSPLGPFEPFGAEQLTPLDWQCLDGTLWIEDGAPWMVFCHEWTQIGDGTMCALPLKDDLSAPAGEAVTLFAASALPWVKSLVHEGKSEGNLVTDAPWLYRARDGSLNMLWSTFGVFGYGVARAVSASGRISGPWIMQDTPVYDRDGGHCMLFTDLQGQTRMSLHGPNIIGRERGLYLTARVERDGRVILPQAE